MERSTLAFTTTTLDPVIVNSMEFVEISTTRLGIDGHDDDALSELELLPSSSHSLQQLRNKAALKIQRAWRANKIRKKYLKPEFLWADLTTQAQLEVCIMIVYSMIIFSYESTLLYYEL